MNTDGNVQLHAVVEGHVQGVGFRYFVIDQAAELGLSGWVRNTHTGNVEVRAEGSRANLEKLLAGLEKGPRSATVLTVSQEWLPACGEWRGFNMRPTV